MCCYLTLLIFNFLAQKILSTASKYMNLKHKFCCHTTKQSFCAFYPQVYNSQPKSIKLYEIETAFITNCFCF